MQAGLNPMLRFRTYPHELKQLQLGSKRYAGANEIYLYPGKNFSGGTKVFRGPDDGSPYVNCGMTFYYRHVEACRTADFVLTIWGNFRFVGQLLFNVEDTQWFESKYPNLCTSIYNGALLMSGQGNQANSPLFFLPIAEDCPEFGLFVPFDETISVENDLETCMFDDVNAASEQTQLLLRASMALDNEINENSEEFKADTLRLHPGEA